MSIENTAAVLEVSAVDDISSCTRNEVEELVTHISSTDEDLIGQVRLQKCFDNAHISSLSTVNIYYSVSYPPRIFTFTLKKIDRMNVILM